MSSPEVFSEFPCAAGVAGIGPTIDTSTKIPAASRENHDISWAAEPSADVPVNVKLCEPAGTSAGIFTISRIEPDASATPVNSVTGVERITTV